MASTAEKRPSNPDDEYLSLLNLRLLILPKGGEPGVPYLPNGARLTFFFRPNACRISSANSLTKL